MSGAAPAARHRVLVVDDEPEVRETVAEGLAAAGWEVLQAANGLEALLAVKRGRPAAVVLDVAMPRLGGLGAIRHILGFDPTIRVVVVTALDDDGVRREALAQGAAAVLAKPVSAAALSAALGAPAGEPADPAVAAPPDDPGPAARPAPGAPAPRGRVLVVDDDPDLAATLVEFLAGDGYRADAVGDAGAALRAVAAAPPDVVLLDIELPGLSGVEALPALHAVAPGARVIVISGTSSEALARQALARGAYDFVTKPLDLAYLARSVETALLMKQLEP